jgi:purine-binding chemotaxis protein CheW
MAANLGGAARAGQTHLAQGWHRATRTTAVEDGSLEVVVFELAGQLFGVPAVDVRELLRAVAVVPLPRAPAVVKGVINLRGRVVPVLDVRGRFRVPAKEIEPADHFIVARAGDHLVALHVDRATDLVRLSAGDLDNVRGLVPEADYVSWVARVPNNLVVIHDLATFLSRGEAVALEEALSAAAPEGAW